PLSTLSLHDALPISGVSGHRQESTSDKQTSARFQRAAHDRQLRWRDPALPLQYVPAVRGRHSPLPTAAVGANGEQASRIRGTPKDRKSTRLNSSHQI